ncbi:MAG: NUDIX domain-containing protein [Thermoguttaceae bacterium]|jgi:predicted NUDIX family NTP pyrophosphohydrolase
MPRLSAGPLMYRIKDGTIQDLLAHTVGSSSPKGTTGAWSITKGELDPDEDVFVAAQREFEEVKCPLPLFHQITSMSLIT